MILGLYLKPINGIQKRGFFTNEMKSLGARFLNGKLNKIKYK